MNSIRKKVNLFCIIFVLILLAADQLTKYLAVLLLKEKPSVILLKGILEFKYLENRGIAFGMFQGAVAFFFFFYVIIFAVAFYCLYKIPKTSYFMPLFSVILLMLAGGIGNFIDRIFRGYVVDFVYFSLIDFPIFNLADIYVVVGCILLVLLVCFKYKDEDFAVLYPKKKD